MHSHTTQPNLDHSFTDTSDVHYATQWISTNDHQHARELTAGPPQMSTEDLLLASQLQASREFAMDAPVNASMQSVAFHHSHSMSRQSISADSFAGNTSFDDSQLLDRDGNEEGDFSGLPAPAKTGSRSSANNEMEMRQLFQASRHRTLQDVAEELHGNERGPNSERTRQVFAMLWYATMTAELCGLY